MTMKKIFFPILLIVLTGLISCEGYLDINDDPTAPTDATIIDLLPSGQAACAFGLANQLNRAASDNVQYLSGRYDSWAISPDDLSNAWRFSLYAGGLKDLQIVIEKATESGNFHFAGVAKLMQAYTFSIMVDVWDDIPYSEALNNEILHPVFDDASSIYDNLLALIDEGIADLDRDLPDLPADMRDADLIFSGNLNKWKKMGYTLKLKMYNQIRLVDASTAKSNIESLVSSGNLISANADDFLFQFGSSTTPSNQHPGYQNDYTVKGEAYINSHFYEVMQDNFDPRLPYFFYRQDGTFDGRYTGDPTPTGNDDDTRTVQGLYSVGGKYDDSSEESVGSNSAAGDGRFRMVTNVMRLFIECEAALALDANVSDTPENLFRKALEANFAEINSLDAPNISETAKDNYINARITLFNEAANNDDKLAIVMEDKWITSFGNALEAYNDYRRTGYPVLPPPLVASNNVVSNRFPYPSDELSANSNAPAQPLNNVKVFWDN